MCFQESTFRSPGKKSDTDVFSTSSSTLNPHRSPGVRNPRTTHHPPTIPGPATLHSRVNGDSGPWCIPYPGAYVRYRFTARIAKPLVSALLHEAYDVVQDIIADLGDGEIEPDGFSWQCQHGLRVSTWNMRGQKTT